MISNDKGTTEIKGDLNTILCEFESLTRALGTGLLQEDYDPIPLLSVAFYNGLGTIGEGQEVIKKEGK